LASDVVGRLAALAWTGHDAVVAWSSEDQWGTYNRFNLVRITPGQAPTATRVFDHSKGSQFGGRLGLATSGEQIGVAWVEPPDNQPFALYVQTFSADLDPITSPVLMTGDSPDPYRFAISGTGDSFLVAWEYLRDRPIMGAVIGSDGAMRTKPKPLTDSAFEARDPSFALVGGHALLIYDSLRDNSPGLAINAVALDYDLAPLSAETRITNTPGNSVYPLSVVGPNDDVFIFYSDTRDGPARGYMTRLTCNHP
jgi:hypothetical protein